MKSLLLLFTCFVLFNDNLVFSDVSPLEKQLILEWLDTTVGYPWNVTTDPCTWRNFYCNSNRTSVEGIYVNVPLITLTTGFLMYGGLPNLPKWAEAKRAGLAFTELRFVNFSDYRTGPIFPDWAEDFWTNYNDTNPRDPFNFVLDCHYATSFICLPESESINGFPTNFKWNASRNVACTNINVVSLYPDHGPSSGGTSVFIRTNAPLGYKDIYCSFGSEDGLTQLVPIQAIFFQSYPWADFNNATFSVDYFTYSIIQCISPPHPPGEVTLRVFAGNISVTNTQIAKYYYECKPGTYGVGPDRQTCLPCSPGTWSPGAVTKCLPCGPGSYAPGWGNTECSMCTNGTYGTDITASNKSVCVPCDPGTMGNSMGASSCTPCDPGTYSFDPGSTSCTFCKAGFYQPQRGNTSCIPCPPGMWNDQPQAKECYYCPIGTYSPSYGATSCVACLTGTTTDDRGATECKPCNPGYYRPADAVQCLPCIPGRYSNGTGAVTCRLCDKGMWNAAWNSTQCFQCPPDTKTVNKGSTSCVVTKPKTVVLEDHTMLIVGIILVIVAIILSIIAIVYIIVKRREQQRRQQEVDAIKAIMDEVT